MSNNETYSDFISTLILLFVFLQFICVEMSVRNQLVSCWSLRQALLLLLWCCARLCWCCSPFTWDHTGQEVWNKHWTQSTAAGRWRSDRSWCSFFYCNVVLLVHSDAFTETLKSKHSNFRCLCSNLCVVKFVEKDPKPWEKCSLSLKELVAVWCSSVSVCQYVPLHNSDQTFDKTLFIISWCYETWSFRAFYTYEYCRVFVSPTVWWWGGWRWGLEVENSKGKYVKI